jgi:BirA family biotin operon repressor/biotin-[acetyl-CoA-carboxylase] ligase
VIGLGINVNHTDMPPELKGIATSLRIEGGKPYSRIHVLVLLLKELERYYHVLLERGTGEVAECWAAVSTYARGKRIRVRTGSGEYGAVTAGLDSTGALRIRRDNGAEESLVSGEVLEVK